MTNSLRPEEMDAARLAVFRIALAMIAICFAGPVAADGRNSDETRIVLSEHLGLTWTNEVVTYPFSADKGLFPAESISLRGPDGAQACQLADVTLWEGTKSVRSARLSFLVKKLAPQTTQTYVISRNSRSGPGKFKTYLNISTRPGQIEATSSGFGVRLLVGEKSYDAGAPAGKVPAPILGIRLANGPWFGTSSMFGSTPIKSYRARVVDSGPIFLRVLCLYSYADGNTLEIAIRLNAAGRGVDMETRVARHSPKDGWSIRLSPGLGPMTLQFPREAAGKQSGATRIGKSNWMERPISQYAPGTITKLTPWGDWWNEFTQPDIHLKLGDSDAEIILARKNAGRWVEPVKGGSARFGYFEPKAIPLVKQPDGTVALRVNNASGARIWSISKGDDPASKLTRYASLKGPASGLPLELDQVKDMVLDWPDSKKKHPWLIMNASEMARAARANPDAMSRLTAARTVKSLEELLGRLGEFDLMRKIGHMAGQYDAIIDSDVITPRRRKLLRARMAYLAYYAASPANWSPSRGYRSGNPNMTIAHTLNQGVLACLLKDHPMARRWSVEPTARMRHWIAKTVDDDGYWNESSHYARVSISKLMFYAIAARQAGLADFLSDPKFKKMCMLYERLLTPPDPQRELPVKTVRGKPKPTGPGFFPRVSAPHGRGERGDRWGMGGLLARAYFKQDPDYSAIMQWSWKQTGMTYIMGEGMGGLERLYADPSLPEKVPSWSSERIKRLGYLLRDGTGTSSESFLLFISQFATNPDGEIWPSETGAITRWFARGVPISGQFNGYPYSNLHSMLLNRVTPAADYKPGQPAPATGVTGRAKQDGFTTLANMDYAAATFELTSPWSRVFSLPKAAPPFPATKRKGKLPITWKRQLMSIKGNDADGVSYIVLRDTISGDQPTQWRFWTFSEKIVSPSQAADRTDRKKCLADAPGENILGPRELKGNRFTALGQFDMDLEYFIASPAATPKHTVRYGLKPSAADVPRFSEYQDMLQLTLDGAGSYYAAMFPRKPEQKAPAFTASSDKRIITVSSDWGADHVFLSAEPATSKLADVSFEGVAACIRNRKSGLVLSLGAKGSAAMKSLSLTAPFGASLTAGRTVMKVAMAPKHPAGEIIISAPGAWKLRPDQSVTLTKESRGRYKLTVPAGKAMVELIRVK